MSLSYHMTDVLIRRHRDRENVGRETAVMCLQDKAHQRQTAVTRSEEETRSRVLGRNQSC